MVAAGGALAAVAAGLSIALQGMAYGFGDNYFHLPFLLRWYDDPQFAGDALIQILRGYTSGYLALLQALATEDNIRALLFAGHWFGRAVVFAGMFVIASALERNRSRRDSAAYRTPVN